MCILLHCLEHWTSNEEGAGLKPAVAKQNVATWSAIVIFSVAAYINYHRATAVIISAVLSKFYFTWYLQYVGWFSKHFGTVGTGQFCALLVYLYIRTQNLMLYISIILLTRVSHMC